MSIPPFDSVQDGDRLTIVVSARRDPKYSNLNLLGNDRSVGTINLLGNDRSVGTINKSEYEAHVVKVERATWNEVAS